MGLQKRRKVQLECGNCKCKYPSTMFINLPYKDAEDKPVKIVVVCILCAGYLLYKCAPYKGATNPFQRPDQRKLRRLWNEATTLVNLPNAPKGAKLSETSVREVQPIETEQTK